MRVAVETPHAGRRRTILRALCTAFRALDADNSLVAKRVKPSGLPGACGRCNCRAHRAETQCGLCYAAGSRASFLSPHGTRCRCTTEFGAPIEPCNFNRTFYRIRDKAKLSAKINLHALRLTYATRLIERDVPMKTAQVLLGHASYQVTADTYSHVAQESETQAVQVLNDLLPKSSKPPHSAGKNRKKKTSPQR
ncbi:hypothetical protein kuro4_01960 [Gelria sp. Kuro-4]|nr:hypothetical protein kuro4_01960 [Gelria sp. Kuro-4]